MTPHAYIDRALGAGVALVSGTLGGNGVLAATAALAPLAMPAFAVDVVDTVGAGDTFQAALLSFLSRHGLLARTALQALDAVTLLEALAFAGRAASITCSRRGADLPRLAEVPAGEPRLAP
jgi:fructokinase